MPLPADDNRHRRVIMETCCRIHQLRMRLLGISQKFSDPSRPVRLAIFGVGAGLSWSCV
ncbi:hypothetical protein V1517DRAFT_316132, partial [Lipomyces orientalis]